MLQRKNDRKTSCNEPRGELDEDLPQSTDCHLVILPRKRVVTNSGAAVGVASNPYFLAAVLPDDFGYVMRCQLCQCSSQRVPWIAWDQWLSDTDRSVLKKPAEVIPYSGRLNLDMPEGYG